MIEDLDREQQELFEKLINAYNAGDKKALDKLKYEYLCFSYPLIHIVFNYIILNKFNIHFDFGKSIIPIKTKLYRIRKFENNIDFADPQQWTAPPVSFRRQNRANRDGEEALYLGSMEESCLLETHIGIGDKYAVGMYEVIDNITLGGFFEPNIENELHFMAGIVLNAFLIAPARAEKNKDIMEYLDTTYSDISLNDFKDWQNNFDLPFRFAVLSKGNDYYKLTNEICDILKSQYPEGIRYSSCYLPFETFGIRSNAYNVVLYKSGISKIKFVCSEVKTNHQNHIDIDMVKMVCNFAKNIRIKKHEAKNDKS